MRLFWLLCLVLPALALRMLTSASGVKLSGNMGGKSGADALCRALGQPYFLNATTWIAFLDTSPPSLQSLVESYGSSIYPYTDVLNSSVQICNTSLFGSSAIMNILSGDDDKFTGWGGVLTCSGWTVRNSGEGAQGRNRIGDQWLQSGSTSCGYLRALTCLEVPRSANFAPPITTFPTSTRHTGNLGGLPGADAICAARASEGPTTSTRGGRWYALLSSPGISLLTRMESTMSSRALLLLAPKTTALTTDNFFNSMGWSTTNSRFAWNEQGVANYNAALWTGAISNGGISTYTCSGWTSLVGSGQLGNSNDNSGDVFAKGTNGCSGFMSLMCLQYFSPIVSVSSSPITNSSQVTVTATLYDDIIWKKFRCVVALNYITNASVFWANPLTNLTYAIAETDNSSSPVIVTTARVATARNLYVTCAARANNYTALTWFSNVGVVNLPSPPIVFQPLVGTTSINVSLLTNATGTFLVRCVIRPTLVTSDVVWSTPPSTIANNPSTPIYFSFTGLQSHSQFVVSCAQYGIGQDPSLSSPVASLNASTLPRCVDIAACPLSSACIDSTDGSLFQCSPYIDGGLHFANASAPSCTSLGGSALSLNLNTIYSESISFCIQVGNRTNLAIPNALSVFYGTSSSPRRFACTNVVLGPAIGTTMQVTCQTSPGIGAGFNISVVYQNKLVSGKEVLNYPPPKIINNTLRLASDANATTILYMESACVDTIAFKVANVLPTQELSVSYGIPPDIYTCSLDSRTNEAEIYCNLSPSTEYQSHGGLNFTVNAAGQKVQGSDVVILPTGRPIIDGVNCTACTRTTGGGLENCPTAGHTFSAPAVLTIYGRNFGSGYFRAYVDGASCMVTNKTISSDLCVAECTLPEGTGSLRGLLVQSDVVFSAPRAWISYAPPTITQICGCEVPCSDLATVVTGCNRNGSQLLEIFGSNFGLTAATVLVGVDTCRHVVHDSCSPHTHLTCTLPPGAGLDRPILVIQGNGAAASSTASVSFTQCGIGTYQLGTQTDCQNCSAGTFSALRGLTSCTECSPGSMVNATGQTTCMACEPGFFQPLAGQANCSLCEQGTISNIFGRTVCEGCSVGKFVDTKGGSLCKECDAGFFQRQTSETSCFPCAVGKYQGGTAQSVCIDCFKGSLAPEVNSTSCTSCEPGKYQSDLGESRCDLCVAGRFTGSSGTAECLPCPAGSYFEGAGATECTRCDSGSAQASFGQSTCALCTSGRFASVPGSASCELCPLGSIAPRSGWNTTCVTCPPGANPADTLCACSPGFEWTGERCAPCVTGQDCGRFGVVRGENVALPGFLRVGNETLFQMCMVSTYCPGGATSCAPFREGALCQSCVAGYREDNGAADGSCSACPSNAASVGNITGVGIILVAVLVLLYYAIVRGGMRGLDAAPVTRKQHWWTSLSHDSSDLSNGADQESAAEIMTKASTNTKETRVEKTVSYQLKIVITFVQLATSALTLSTLSLPPIFRAFLAAFDFVNLNFIPWNYVGCLANYSLITKIIVTAVAPFVLLPVAGSLLFLVLKIQDRNDTQDNDTSRNTRAKYRAVFWRVTLFTVFLAYPAVSRQIFAYFRCVEIVQASQPSLYLLRESFHEECYDAAWFSNLGIVVFLICVYPLGVPLGLGYVLRRYHHLFHEKYVRYSLGFAFEGFVSELWFFEMLDMTHKLFVASIVSLLPAAMQVQAAMAVLGFYLCVLSYCQPYVRAADNQLHLVTQVALYLLVFSFLAREQTGAVSPGSEEDILLSSLLIAIFVSVLVFYLSRMAQFYRLAYQARKRRSHQRKQAHSPSGASKNDSMDLSVNSTSTSGIAEPK